MSRNFIHLVLVLATALGGRSVLGDDVCGQITGTVHIPSYRFSVKADDGAALSEVPASASVDLDRAIWSGDHWGEESDIIQIAVSYDTTTGTYVSAETDIPVPSHWSGLNPSCAEKLQSFVVKFNSAPKTASGFDISRSSQTFEYDFPQSGSNYSLPDASSTQAIVLKTLNTITGIFTDATHITDATGVVTQVTWSGQPSTDNGTDASSPGLTAAEIQLINDSIAQKSAVKIYSPGSDSNGVALISDVVRSTN